MKGNASFFIRVFFFGAAFAWLVSCAEKRAEGILTKAQMVKVMQELYVAEEKVNELALSRDSAKEVFPVMRDKVFENAGIRDSVFKKSLDYYMERPKEMELIYTALVDTLQLREQRAPMTR